MCRLCVFIIIVFLIDKCAGYVFSYIMLVYSLCAHVAEVVSM